MPDLDPLTAEDAAYMIKARLREAVRMAGGGSFVAGKIGLSAAHLSKVQSPHYAEQIRPDFLPVIERMAGSPVVTEGFAEAQGYRLALDLAGEGTAGLQDLARLVRQTSSLTSTYTEALSDLDIDAHERRQLIPLFEEAIRELNGQLAKLYAAGGGR